MKSSQTRTVGSFLMQHFDQIVFVLCHIAMLLNIKSLFSFYFNFAQLTEENGAICTEMFISKLQHKYFEFFTYQPLVLGIMSWEYWDCHLIKHTPCEIFSVTEGWLFLPITPSPFAPHEDTSTSKIIYRSSWPSHKHWQ